MSSVLPIVLAGAGIALATRGKESADEPERAGPPRRGNQVDEPAPPSAPRTGLAALKARHGVTWVGAEGISEPAVVRSRMESHTSVPKEIMDRAEKRMKDAWDKASGAAKREICARMKAEFPDDENIQQLDCDKPLWEQLLNAAIIAGATAAGAAICGPVCGALAGSMAAVIGVEVTDWVAGAWDDLSDDAQELWDETGDWFEGVYQDAEEWLDDLNPF